jgi:hypothetical protein
MPTKGLLGVEFDLLPEHLAAHGATPALEPEVTPNADLDVAACKRLHSSWR